MRLSLGLPSYRWHVGRTAFCGGTFRLHGRCIKPVQPRNPERASCCSMSRFEEIPGQCALPGAPREARIVARASQAPALPHCRARTADCGVDSTRNSARFRAIAICLSARSGLSSLAFRHSVAPYRSDRYRSTKPNALHPLGQELGDDHEGIGHVREITPGALAPAVAAGRDGEPDPKMQV